MFDVLFKLHTVTTFFKKEFQKLGIPVFDTSNKTLLLLLMVLF